jgi:hypothetical protein
MLFVKQLRMVSSNQVNAEASRILTLEEIDVTNYVTDLTKWETEGR